MTKSTVLQIRITSKEKSDWQARAKQCGLSMSDWLRAVAGTPLPQKATVTTPAPPIVPAIPELLCPRCTRLVCKTCGSCGRILKGESQGDG